MRVEPVTPPRVFQTGRDRQIRLTDCARLALDPDEQVTFVTPSGAEYDVARKSWGFYATGSLDARLPRFNLRAALVVNPAGRHYIFLVERGWEADCQSYMDAEGIRVAAWLDGEAAGRLVCLCGGRAFDRVFQYRAPPEGENRFPGAPEQGYRRTIERCCVCGHYLSVHRMDLGGLYGGAYADSVYRGDQLRAAFERIVALPSERSDNAGRVARVESFAARHWPERRESPSLLDIGSGLGVFAHAMKARGWRATALDPDPRAAAHARQAAGVEAICAGLPGASIGRQFDLVAFNKVLEHVEDPVAMLGASRSLVAGGGFVYVEVPDGEAAAAEGRGREEFFIEHHHVFSAASLALLAVHAGFRVCEMDRLREPSAKFTLRAFLTPTAEGVK
jgi:SAM-dependent methyltransferase